MSIYEYDEEKHMRQEREASWEEGRGVGRRGRGHCGIDSEDRIAKVMIPPDW